MGKRNQDLSEPSDEADENMEQQNGPVENAWALSIPAFSKGDMKHHLQEETRFQVTFPKYREKYIKESWPLIEKIFEEQGIKGELNLIEGVMSVATTRKTWDPFMILKSRDLLKLIARSVPVEHAVKVLKDDVTSEIVKIKNIIRNKERFLKRRQRLIGSNGTALKTLELLTDCYILLQGCTVAVIGPHRGVQEVMKVVLDTMNNVHPIYLLKALMVKRSLSKDTSKKNEDWTKYVPSYSISNVPTKKPKKIRVKKPYTPFPPERVERKEDESMESGRYFVEREEKMQNKKWRKRIQDRRKKSDDKQMEKRKIAYAAPKEPTFTSHAISTKAKGDVDVKQLKKKLKVKKAGK